MKYRRTGLCAILLIALTLLLAGCAGKNGSVTVQVDRAGQPSSREVFAPGEGLPEDRKPEGDYVRIQVDSRTVRLLPLDEPCTVTLTQDGDKKNIIRVTGDGVVMESANCLSQDCVHMGEVNRDNWETRVQGAFIICLPHRVTVELVVRD